jgi:hypothetical protein
MSVLSGRCVFYAATFCGLGSETTFTGASGVMLNHFAASERSVPDMLTTPSSSCARIYCAVASLPTAWSRLGFKNCMELPLP